MSQAYIALGSNIEPLKYFKSAHQMLNFSECSSIYESSSLLPDGQNNYWNQVCILNTDLSPQMLLSELKKIEQIIGREKSYYHGPRQIDLDILLFDDIILNTKELTIPHKDLLNRPFFLLPLQQIYKSEYLPNSIKLADAVYRCDNCSCRVIAKDLIDAKDAYQQTHTNIEL